MGELRLNVTFAGHVQPWLKNFLARNPTGVARAVSGKVNNIGALTDADLSRGLG